MPKNTMIRSVCLMAATAAAFVCGAQTPAPSLRATISPTLARLSPGGEQKFKAIVLATRLKAARAPAEVRWSVNGIRGGNAELGTIDEKGLYHAPSQAPKPRELHICAEVPEASNHHLWATVIIGEGAPVYRSIGRWAEPDAKTSRLKNPHGISIDADGNLLIADQGAGRIFRYTKQGKFVGEIGLGPGSEEGQFTDPRFAAADASGEIYVVDVKSDRPRMQVFDRTGKFLRIFAEKGTPPGHILRGHGIAFDERRRVYVTDVDNMRVSIFEPDGKFVSCWGKDGPRLGDFNAPHGLYMDANNDVFINGYYGPTQKFTSEGDYLLSLGFGDPPEGSVYFHSVTGDRWGNVILTVRTKAGYGGALESNIGRKVSMVKYNNYGDFITTISLSAKEHSESWSVVDSDGTIYALFKGKGESGVEIFAEE